jgi:hypothetical protein
MDLFCCDLTCFVLSCSVSFCFVLFCFILPCFNLFNAETQVIIMICCDHDEGQFDEHNSQYDESQFEEQDRSGRP